MAIVDHWNSSLSVVCITVAFLAIVFMISSILSPLDQDVTNMLKQNGLSRKSYENMLLVAGLPDDKDVAEINIEEVQEALGSISYKYEDILLAISSYQDTILLQLFFEKYEVPNIVSNRLKSKHITTLSHLEMAAKDKDFLPDLFSPSEKEYQESLNISLKYIPKTFKRKSKLLKQYSLSRKPGFLWKFFYKTVLIVLTILIGAVIILVIFVMECISRLSGLRRFGSGSPTATLSNFLSLLSRNRSAHVSNNVEFHVPPLNNQNNKLWLWDFFTGAYVHAQSCIVTWGWEDLQEVGGTVSFSIKLMQKNGKPFKITNSSSVFVEIKHKDVAVTFTKKPVECKDNNVLLVSFSVHKSGIYHIDVMVSGKHIKGSPFFKEFEAGPIDARQTGFSNYCSTIVCTAGVPYSLSIGTHDSFGNPTVYKPETNNYFKIRVTESESSMKYCPVTQLINQPEKKMLTMRITMSREGLYNASVSYGDVKLRNGDFNILVVSNEDMACVNKNMAKKNRNIWYEARLLSGNSEEKAKKVYVYVSPKQLTLKEYYLKIIGKKINTWRVCPSTKFYFNGHNSKYDLPVLTIHDCCQPPITIASKDRSIIAATFTNFLLRNIGGSETFLDKQTFFVQELRKSQKRGSHTIRIDRQNFLYSAFRQTKHYDAGDWYKVFEVMFLGEQGLDWGGLRREFFECICTHLFDPSNSGLFMRFSDDSQGLVHPNPKRKPEMKLKYYEFAGKIVGKCLFDSAMGSLYRQLVKARFSRSFLAQIIGLQVNYKYFETDDPELYKTKIKFIEDNNIDDMELTFSDEEYSPDGQLVKVVDLIPNGSNKMVTNENKQQYLNCLAQYRLATCVRDEVDAFMKGLNMLISDSLLSIFDENELELLMCGTGNYNISDFKANATLERSPAHSSKVLEWFWTIVGSFTEEQMARLLQFTTGCSQLPAGGFAELNPKFHISFTPNFNTLPMAHTCFNQLCLPDYDSLESFHRLILIAINEGSQGFGLV